MRYEPSTRKGTRSGALEGAFSVYNVQKNARPLLSCVRSRPLLLSGGLPINHEKIFVRKAAIAFHHPFFLNQK
jgi:hypothetical protein